MDVPDAVPPFYQLSKSCPVAITCLRILQCHFKTLVSAGVVTSNFNRT